MELLAINWNVDPVAFSVAGWPVRWYGLLFAGGFALGYGVMRWIFRREGAEEKWLDPLLALLLLGGILGARLGHVFFYNWDHYATHPLEILNLRQGGLASHGGLIANLLLVWVFARLIAKRSFWWLSDRLALPVAMVAGLIRLGNLMNHEIVGARTELPWAFVFERYTQAMAGSPDLIPMPRHPVQLYEALAYFAIVALLVGAYLKTPLARRPGRLSGLFLSLVFGARFFLEFVKMPQNEFDATHLITTGQWLSVPVVALGLWLVFRPSPFYADSTGWPR